MDFLRGGLIESLSNFACKTAFIEGDESVSYQQLDLWSNALVRDHLAEMQHDRVLLVCSNNRFDAVVYLAALKAGKTLALLDSREPSSRIRQIALDLGCANVFLSAPHEVQGVFPTVDIREFVDLPNERSETPLPWHFWNLDDPAWIYFTSGSTGEPKGVVVPYRRRASANFVTDSSINSSTRMGGTRPLSFLAGGTNLLRVFFSGACFVQIDTSGLSAKEVFEQARKLELTHLALPPSYLRNLSHLSAMPKVESVGEVLLTGQGVERLDILSFWSVLPNAALRNSYGSTELGTVAVASFAKGGSPPEDPVPAGHPVDCEVYVLDENGVEKPIGEAGQIAVVSKRRAHGYLVRGQHVDLNEVLLQNGASAVLTGDVGFVNTAGVLHVLGRLDDIVKVNGQLVNTQAVRTTLLKMDDLLDAEVLPYQCRRGRTRIGVIVTTRSELKPSQESIRQHLMREAPSWTVPSRIVFVDAIPRGNRGKTDRMTLLEMLEPRATANRVNSEMGDPVIYALRNLVQQFVSLDEVSIHTDLRFVGLDSLDTTELVEMINQEFGVNLPISELTQPWSLSSLRMFVTDNARAPRKRVVQVSTGTHSTELYWLLPGTNLIVGMALAGYLNDFQSKFFVARGAEKRESPYLSIQLVAEDLIDQYARQMTTSDIALIGFSSASWIVQHMAVLFERLGVSPQALIMIDPPSVTLHDQPSAPPDPGLLVRAREGQLISEIPHESDVLMLNLQLFGLRNHLPSPYEGRTLVILGENSQNVRKLTTTLMPKAEVVDVSSPHLELMRNPEICGPTLRRFLQ